MQCNILRYCTLYLRRVLDLDFQEYPSNRSRDTVVNVFCTARELSFITSRSLTN